MGRARRGSRGWRGVIDRPGREDFKVSETSQECDRDCTVRETQSESVSERARQGEGAGECRNKSTTLNVASGRPVGERMSFNGRGESHSTCATPDAPTHDTRRNLANAVSESVRLFGRHLSGFPLAARLDGWRLVPPGRGGRVMKLAR